MSSESPSAVVSTGSGNVRGVAANGIESFKGIPYGAPTSGPGRFMAPAPAAPWSGTLEAVSFGAIAPQSAPGRPRGGVATPTEDTTGREGEDCLVLNVYTPGVNAEARRPVMVWLHGGGFVTGSGGAAYDGSNLARRGDVVVVSINHRLGSPGYLHLGDIDPAFAASGNAGMLDIVLALEWVRDNVGAFGGDAGNVTIFGESGGGRKVATLMAMPAAKGLFHRAVIESGPGIRANDRDYATGIAEAMLAELGLDRTQARKLQEVSIEDLMTAQAAVLAKTPTSGPAGGFRPVVDPAVLPRHPFEPAAPDLSAEVPLLIGFNRTEATLFLANDKEVFELDEERMRVRVQRLFKDKAELVLDGMRRIYPEASPSDLYVLIHTGFMRYPIDSIKLAERKAAQGGAPVYLYKFEWETTARFGQMRTPHAIEIPFVFDIVDQATWLGMTRGTPEAHALAAKVSATWAAFARTGSPNSGDLPKWDPFTIESRQTMRINNESALENDPASEERKLWESVYYA